MASPTRILPFVVAVVVLGAATATTTVATAGSMRATTPCAPGAAGHRCVFLAPFDRAAAGEAAVYRVDVRFGLLNYVATRSTCRPTNPDQDRLGRKGWNRVSCHVDLIAQTGDDCAIERDGVSKEPASCTGTIWQLDGDSGAVIRDTGARRARFGVVMLKHPAQCWIVARITQLPPFTPRFERP